MWSPMKPYHIYIFPLWPIFFLKGFKESLEHLPVGIDKERVELSLTIKPLLIIVYILIGKTLIIFFF